MTAVETQLTMGRSTSYNLAGQTADIEKTMAPSTLDLLFLTFNCAKNLIDVGVFSSHLHGALSQNAAGLPDLVAFSLQEVAPISYAFIGSYFLSPYYARYEEALNLASARLLATSSAEGANGGPEYAAQSTPSAMTPRPYTMVRAKNVGMTALLLFARDPAAIQSIEEAEAGFGAADMGNKGAVALRVTWGEPGQHELGRTTEVTLVATHLAAMEWNLKKRNANWRTIMSSLTFANPRAALPGLFAADNTAPTPDRSGVGGNKLAADSSESSEAEPDEDDTPLLNTAGDRPLTPEQRATLQDLSIFKPTSHLFVAGDLNYRIGSTTPSPLAPFPSFDPTSEHYYPKFLPRDQLTQERLAGRAFHGMTEAPITFGPTYKYNILRSADGADNAASVRRGTAPNGIPEVPWRFASHRWPGWCDRVLYLDLPAWVQGKNKAIEVKAYDSLPVVRTSDHRAVFFRASIPIVSAEDMLSPSAKAALAAAESDPRCAPPVAVDVHAWERRAAARQKEVAVGWSAFFWSTKEGAVVLATLFALSLGVWWFWTCW
ncbi:Endonuclease/exonuclease/phosphatase [Cercophora newfieldiana]|uniref:Endonuclease/exonuclease/phosphatase n=1 Tax=Cercophora newfieldiana TaxID=92897 RepID=A0AA39YNN1_9PEZI|nr:Endonuclease/exonuclease/phosphatase [Cercophora newfieldiana]